MASTEPEGAVNQKKTAAVNRRFNAAGIILGLGLGGFGVPEGGAAGGRGREQGVASSDHALCLSAGFGAG